MFLLNVPYEEKDAAKQLGAHWDAKRKKWYIPKGVLAAPFAQWMPGGALADKLLSKQAVKKVGKGLNKRSKRVDASAGRIVVGANYKRVEGAVGPPWDA